MSGKLSPLPHGGGATALLSEEQKLQLVDIVAANPEATLEEIRREIKKHLRINLSIGTVWNMLDSLDLTRKKSLDLLWKPTSKSALHSKRDKRGWRAKD